MNHLKVILSIGVFVIGMAFSTSSVAQAAIVTTPAVVQVKPKKVKRKAVVRRNAKCVKKRPIKRRRAKRRAVRRLN